MAVVVPVLGFVAKVHRKSRQVPVEEELRHLLSLATQTLAQRVALQHCHLLLLKWKLSPISHHIDDKTFEFPQCRMFHNQNRISWELVVVVVLVVVRVDAVQVAEIVVVEVEVEVEAE